MFFGCLSWLHQGRIPRHTCRFYWFLAGAHKEATLFLGFYSGFTRGEYHVIRVDFIVALRRTKGRGRRTLRSPPSPSSGLHLIHPGYPLRRGNVGCRGFGTILESGIRCCRYSPVRNLVLLSVFGLRSFAFQSGCWACVARFSLLGDGLFVPAATWGFCYVLS